MKILTAINLVKSLIKLGQTNEEIRNHPKFVEQRKRHAILHTVNMPNDKAINSLRATINMTNEQRIAHIRQDPTVQKLETLRNRRETSA